jgi:CheY-like chemotaxis protein
MIKKIDCILLVDDDEIVNYLNNLKIKKAEIATVTWTATNGKKAIEFLTNTGEFESNMNSHVRPLLIVLDINMPVMDGWEFMEAYKKLDLIEKDKIIIVMHTTSSNAADQLRAESIPEIAEFTKKPLTQVMIDTIVQKHFPQLL